MRRMVRSATVRTALVVLGAASVTLTVLGASFVPASAGTGDIVEFGGLAVNARPTSVAAGPDGSIWFTEFGTSMIGKMSMDGTVLGEFPVTPGGGPFWVTAGPDGNIWFTEFSAGKIGVMSPSGTVLAEFATPSANSGPDQITRGPNGNLWFTEFNTSSVAEITTSGTVTEFALAAGSGPTGIASGPDGNLWFVEQSANTIGRITTAGVASDVATLAPGTTPAHITSGPDGNLWFTEYDANRIGRVTPGGAVTEFAIGVPASHPGNMTGGPDGNLWFTQEGSANIGRIAPDGAITEFPIPSGASGHGGITTGPDGNMWFAEELDSRIGRLTVSLTDPSLTSEGTPVSATEGNPVSGTVATFTDPDTSSTAADYAATIAWGDGGHSAGTITGAGGSFTVSGTNTYQEEGSYVITVTVSDNDGSGNVSTATTTAAVADAPLTAAGATLTMPNPVAGAGVATLRDGDPRAVPSDFTASIAWGDGTTSAGAVAGPEGGPFVVSGSHTFADLGPTTATTTVCDAGGSCSTATTQIVVFSFPATGAFAIGDQSATGSVTFWGSRWSTLNTASGGGAPAAFKGFEDTNTTPTCGGSWTSTGGNSSIPPAASLPAYMAVVVTSAVTQSDSGITGNVAGIVIVKTDAGYAPDPGHPGTGIVVATVC